MTEREDRIVKWSDKENRRPFGTPGGPGCRTLDRHSTVSLTVQEYNEIHGISTSCGVPELDSMRDAEMQHRVEDFFYNDRPPSDPVHGEVIDVTVPNGVLGK